MTPSELRIREEGRRFNGEMQSEVGKMGREEVEEERRVRVVSMTIDEELLEQLEIYAVKHKMSRSGAVKLAIRKMLEEEGGKK